MKTLLKSILFMFLMIPFVLFAQQGMQDVIYLKDGSIYKGIIIETVPNVSYKIKSKDGNVFAVKIEDIEKITKEEGEHHQDRGYHRGPWGHHYMKGDSAKFAPRQKGYFNEVQVLIENVQGGVRMVNGYKFNRFAYLGIGIGVDRVFSNPFNPKVNGLEKKELAGIYLPLYLYHAGDGPTKGRFTPFYAIEAGYAMAFKGFGDSDRNVDDFGNRLKGGVIAGAGLGFKIHSKRHRGHFSLLFNVNYKQVNFNYDQLFLSQGGQVTATLQKDAVGHLIIPGIRIGIGF
ncbi:MAG: hypothetical protein H6603_02295 [Flavobacteriales bacterium]|nr:hypothetical protein [Flavobacteriales bacterium]MCB9203783.1 hypothetical protein [Flavobacteriales bacterium]